MVYKKGLLLIRQKSSKMFLLAFLVSLTIWFLINLSKTYERTVAVKVTYSNLKKGTFVTSKDSVLKVKLKGSGFSLLSYKFSDLNLRIDSQKYNDKWTWELEDSELNALFSKSIAVVNVTPRTVFFNIKTLSKKKVPILSQIKVTPKLGYGVTTYNLSKDSIFIYGEQTRIDTISAIKTVALDVVNTTESIKGKIALEYQNREIQIHDKEVTYSYEIERFTQGDFPIQIKVRNTPEDKKITIFPKEVHVQFQGALSQFSTYKAEDFGVFVDVNDINETNTLPIHIEYLPKGVVNARVLKKSVTYLVLEE